MKDIPYASIVGSLMYARTCTRPNISFVNGMLDIYQSNPGMDHWKAANNVLQYLQGTKDYMLTYRISDHLDVIEYSYSNYVGCMDTKNLFVPISWRSNIMAECEVVYYSYIQYGS
ncbi:secreted RxLR effector protein 161-like [Nicotiana tabacum]|uniref:Secreted RxLR effector protein 161-like n=1 Tax=Nicotiana tabacum TaxID=4097 RepID=A0AC58TGJ4_TOBAC